MSEDLQTTQFITYQTALATLRHNKIKGTVILFHSGYHAQELRLNFEGNLVTTLLSAADSQNS